MNFDEQAAEAKRQAIRDAAAGAQIAAQVLPDATIDSVLAAFSRVTPPEAPEDMVHFITISSLYSTPKAQSLKPGNVVLNWCR